MIKIRPSDVWTLKYWLHLLFDVVLIGIFINIFLEPMNIDIKFLFFGTLFLGISDIISHTTLQVD